MAYVRFYPGAAPVKQDHISEVFAVFFQIARALFSSKIPLWFEASPFRGKREVDKTAEPMKSFFVTPPFR